MIAIKNEPKALNDKKGIEKLSKIYHNLLHISS